MSPDSTPRYPQIADKLREKIIGGGHAYAYGKRLPTEPQLMDEFKVSRPTIHRALTELEDEGLVELQRGVGSIVRFVRPLLRNVGKRMSSETWRSGASVWDAETEGREYEARIVSRKRGKPSEAAAQFLGDIDVWTREREHYVDGAPVMLSWSHYPAAIVDGSRITEEDTGPGGSPAVLDGLGRALHHHIERMRVLRPDGSTRKRLKLPRGTRVVEILRVSRDREGEIVEVTQMIANSDAFVFQLDYTS